MKKIHFTNSNGFTLAEVLVTLGIIGVVAALTMPTLIENHRKQVLRTQVKKSFSMISQAYGQAVNTLGYSPNCYYWDDIESHHCVEYGDDNECSKWVLDSSGKEIPAGLMGPREGCKQLADALERNLKIVKKCDDHAYSGGCIPEYKGVDTVVAGNNTDLSDADVTKQTTGCLGFRQNSIYNNSRVYVLADGTIYGTYGAGGTYYGTPIFFMDVNGKKGPNKWGHDLFTFELDGSLNSELHVAPGGCFIPEEGGTTAAAIISGND